MYFGRYRFHFVTALQKLRGGWSEAWLRILPFTLVLSSLIRGLNQQIMNKLSSLRGQSDISCSWENLKMLFEHNYGSVPRATALPSSSCVC